MIYSRSIIAILVFTVQIIAMPPAAPGSEPEESSSHAKPPSLDDPNVFKKEVPEEHLTAILTQHPHLPKEYHSHLPIYVAMARDEYENLIDAIAANFNLPTLPVGLGRTSQPPTFLALRRFLSKRNAAILLGLIREPYPLHKYEIALKDPVSPDSFLESKCYDILGYLQRNQPTNPNPSLEKTFHLLLTNLTTLSEKFELAIQTYRQKKLNAYAEKQKETPLDATEATTYPLRLDMFPPLTPAEKTPLRRGQRKLVYNSAKKAPKPPRDSPTENPKKKTQS